jgi:threonine dehydrogenase-like Zn-dependent dehydrogenase
MCKSYRGGRVCGTNLSFAPVVMTQYHQCSHWVDAVAEIRKLTGGAGVDYAVEASGQASVIEQALNPSGAVVGASCTLSMASAFRLIPMS